MKLSEGWPVWPALACLLLASTGCGAMDDFRKSRHLKRAQAYAAEKKWKEASIEYRNVLNLDPENIEVARGLGVAFFESGQFGEAFPLLRRYSELRDDDIEVRLKLGMIYLLARGLDDAREQALFALGRNPRDLDALSILAEASDTPAEVDDVIARLERDKSVLGETDRVGRLLGTLYLRKGDLQRAEQEFNAALTAKPDAAESHLALGRLNYSKGDLQKAEQEYRKAAELASVGSAMRLQLADFYLRIQRTADARRELEAITRQAPDAFAAWLRIAELAVSEGKLDEASKALEPVLKANASDPAALLLKARIHLARREPEEAVKLASRVTERGRGGAGAYYILALAHAQGGNTVGARQAAEQALRLAPAYGDAALLEAQLQARAGDPDLAGTTLRAYLKLQPGDSRAWDALCTVELASRRPQQALEAARKLTAVAPDDPRGPYLMGLALRLAGRAVDARRAFEQALTLSPGYADPLVQLASMTFAERRPGEAIERVRRQAEQQPKSVALRLLLGRAYQANRQFGEAETAYLKALELDPNQVSAYVSLGQIYAQGRQFERAIGSLEKALAAQPDRPSALMLWSVVHALTGNRAKAREGYERLIKQNPRFAPAANNLAWMLAEEGQDLPRAFMLAQVAREAAPKDPSVADTLGWVFYKQKAYPSALALFEEAAQQLPDNGEVQYHLGLAQAALQRKKEAKASITRALALAPGQSWEQAARQALSGL